MNICGIELKSNYAVLVILKNGEFQDLKIKKIELVDDEKQENIRVFCNEFLLFLEKNKVDKVFIKKRAKKGNFAGGANTFKIEALIQLNPFCEVNLICAQSISSFEKKNSIDFPKNLKKYQQQAYLAALSSSKN